MHSLLCTVTYILHVHIRYFMYTVQFEDGGYSLSVDLNAVEKPVNCQQYLDELEVNPDLKDKLNILNILCLAESFVDFGR